MGYWKLGVGVLGRHERPHSEESQHECTAYLMALSYIESVLEDKKEMVTTFMSYLRKPHKVTYIYWTLRELPLCPNSLKRDQNSCFSTGEAQLSRQTGGVGEIVCSHLQKNNLLYRGESGGIRWGFGLKPCKLTPIVFLIKDVNFLLLDFLGPKSHQIMT